MIGRGEGIFECNSMYKILQVSEIFHALWFNLIAWLIELDAALRIFFHFKTETEHLRLHTSPSALTSFAHFYKLTTLMGRTKRYGLLFPI